MKIRGVRPTGSSGVWNATTGNSNGYQQWEVDLTQFAGKQVEVSITYATDPFVQELGVFVDDVEVIADGASVATTSFEDGLGGFTVGGPPEGSGPNSNNWIRSEALFEEYAGIKTRDTVYFGMCPKVSSARRRSARCPTCAKTPSRSCAKPTPARRMSP